MKNVFGLPQMSVVQNAYSGSYGSASSSRYSSPGPYKALDLNPITVRVGTNDEGLPVTAQLQVSVPTGACMRGENGQGREVEV